MARQPVEVITITLDQPEAKRPLFMFLMGDIGSGKTWSLATIAKFGRVVLIDIDQNASGLSTRTDVDRSKIEHVTIGGKPGTTVGASKALDTYLRELAEKSKSDPPAAVVLDSVTSLAQVCMADVLSSSGRLGQTPQLQDYGMQQEHIRRFCLMIGSIPVTHASIITGHIEWDKDEVTGRFMIQLAGLGQKLPAKLMRVFQEIYYADVEMNKNSTEYVWRTRKTKQYSVRTQLGLADTVEQDFAIPFNAYFGERTNG